MTTDGVAQVRNREHAGSNRSIHQCRIAGNRRDRLVLHLVRVAPCVGSSVTSCIGVGVGDGIVAVVVGSAGDDRCGRSQKVVAAVRDVGQVGGRSHHIGEAGHCCRVIVFRDAPCGNSHCDITALGGGATALVTVSDAPRVGACASRKACRNRHGKCRIVSGRDTYIAHSGYVAGVEGPFHIINAPDMADFGGEFGILGGTER